MAEKGILDNGEDKKMKGKMEEESPTKDDKLESEKQKSLSRTLGKRPMVDDDEPPSRVFAFKLLEGPEGSSSGSRTTMDLLGPPEPLIPLSNDDDDDVRNYYCKFCDRKFTNSQALGGHQNAHRSERAILKDPEKYRYGYRYEYSLGLSGGLFGGGGCLGSNHYHPYKHPLFQGSSSTTITPPSTQFPHQYRGHGLLGGLVTNHVPSLGRSSWTSVHGARENNVGRRISSNSLPPYQLGTTSSWKARSDVLEMLNHNSRNVGLPSLVDIAAGGSGIRHQLRVIRSRTGDGDGDGGGVIDIASSSESGNNNNNDNNNKKGNNPSGSTTPNGSSNDDEDEEVDLNLKL